MNASEQFGCNEDLLVGDFHVIRKTSSEFTEDDFTDLGLLELVSDGYGYPLDETAITSVEEDFARADRDRFSLLALDAGKAVSAVSFGRWRPGQESGRGPAFWRLLSREHSTLAQRALAFSDEVYCMIGIVTLPDYRRHGLAKMLLQRGIREGKPSLVLGETKTPSAVLTRARALAELGYRTYYGTAEVTPGREQDASALAAQLSHVYIETYDQPLDDFPVIYTTTDVLLPTMPDVSTFPPPVQAAFADVRSAQLKAGDAKTAVKPLISVAEGIAS